MNIKRALLAFVAGFLATLVFHQGGLAALNAFGLTDRTPFSMSATEPFGVPAVLSLAFWGGIWGMVLVAVLRQRMSAAAFLASAFLFGALLPTAVAMLVVMPLKGQPMAGGWDPQIILGAVILNGLWGFGTAVFYRAISR
jgi:hypothetical protein